MICGKAKTEDLRFSGNGKALKKLEWLNFPYVTEQIKVFLAQLKIEAHSYKSTPDSLRQHFKAFERKPSLGAPALEKL